MLFLPFLSATRHRLAYIIVAFVMSLHEFLVFYDSNESSLVACVAAKFLPVRMWTASGRRGQLCYYSACLQRDSQTCPKTTLTVTAWRWIVSPNDRRATGRTGHLNYVGSTVLEDPRRSTLRHRRARVNCHKLSNANSTSTSFFRTTSNIASEKTNKSKQLLFYWVGIKPFSFIVLCSNF